MKIFRKRFIPNEMVDISDDEVTYRDQDKLMTKWVPIKPREDFSFGESCVYFDKGWKISKFLKEDKSLKYWYCDIVKYEYKEEEDKYIIIDLLLDVIVFQDENYKVLDEDELELALKKGLITKEVAEEARQKLQNLITLIEEGKFKDLTW